MSGRLESNVWRRKVSAYTEETDRKVKGKTLGSPNPIKDAERSKLSDQIYRYSFIPRIIIASLYPLRAVYATYELHLAADEQVDKKLFQQYSPGIFTNLTGRGRDSSDYSWTILSQDYFVKSYLWYGFYAIAARVVQLRAPKVLPVFSAVLSAAFISNLIGLLPLAYLLAQVSAFWVVRRLNMKIAILLTAIGFVLTNRHVYYRGMLVSESDMEAPYYLLCVSGWNLLRCVSFYYDTWNRSQITSVSSLLTCIQYCFYFPLTVWGPLEYFERYETHVLLPSISAKPIGTVRKDVFTMVIKLARFMAWGILNELLMHFVYFKMMSNSIRMLEKMSFEEIGMTLFWLGHFIQLKYVVLYGIPCAIAEADGIPALPLPNCIMCVHRYSSMWRNIDRGMYNWFKRYCYIPTLEILARMDSNNKIKPEFRRVLGSLPSFTFIVLWHGGDYSIILWGVVNYLAIGAERLASYLKRKIDEKYNILPALWDVFVEPVVTMPLVLVSWLNSALFTVSMETAKLFAYRVTFDKVFMITWVIFSQCNLGVLVRTWSQVVGITFPKIARQ